MVLIISVNIPVRDYQDLVAGPDGHVFIAEAIPNESGLVLHRYSIKDRKAIEFLRGISFASSSFDRKNLLYSSGPSWFIANSVAGAPRPGDGRLQTDAMRVYVDPAKEAEQIFKEGWRYQRDFL